MRVIKEILFGFIAISAMFVPFFLACSSIDDPKPIEETKPNYGYIALRNTTGVVCQYYVDTPCDTIAGYDYNARLSQYNETQDTIYFCELGQKIKVMQVRPAGYYVNITTEYAQGKDYLHDFTPGR